MTVDQLRADLTHTLAAFLPPELVAPAVAEAMRVALLTHNPVGKNPATVGAWAASIALATLPSPYREAVEIAEAIAPIVAAWWRDRLVVAPAIVVRDERV